MNGSITLIPTANLVNAMLDLLIQNQNSLDCEPLGNPVLDKGYMQGVEMRLDQAIVELQRRWEHMPAADLVTEELRRRQEARAKYANNAH